MEMVLNDTRLLNITKGNEKCPIDVEVNLNNLTKNERDDFKRCLIKDEKSYSTICLNVRDFPTRQIKAARISKELWTKLEELYETRNSTNRLLLKKHLSTIKMKVNESMPEFLDKYRIIVEELEAIGSPLQEEDKVATLHNSLPISFDNLIVSLEKRSDNLTLEFVNARLIQ